MPPYTINAASGTPIYRQFVDQTRAMVARGLLRAGDAMPSVRAVAGSLGVNPGAVRKAYAVLVRAGVLDGRGEGRTVVADGAAEVATSMAADAEG